MLKKVLASTVGAVALVSTFGLGAAAPAQAGGSYYIDYTCRSFVPVKTLQAAVYDGYVSQVGVRVVYSTRSRPAFYPRTPLYVTYTYRGRAVSATKAYRVAGFQIYSQPKIVDVFGTSKHLCRFQYK